MAKSHTFRKTKPGKPIPFDIKEKIFGTDDLSPLFSVIYNKKESCDGSNSGVVIREGLAPFKSLRDLS